MVGAVIKKRATILSKVKSKYWQRTHKYGIEIPKSISHAKQLDAKNNNTLWWDAICDEMATIRVAFEEIVEGGIPRGYTHRLSHDFRCKAR